MSNYKINLTPMNICTYLGFLFPTLLYMPFEKSRKILKSKSIRDKSTIHKLNRIKSLSMVGLVIWMIPFVPLIIGVAGIILLLKFTLFLVLQMLSRK